jgi:preprotein translocase subunit SecE
MEQFLNFLKISNSLVLGIIVWLLVLALVVLIIRKWARISVFTGEVRGELNKASWPWESDPKIKGLRKYKELIDSTVVVLIGMALLAGFVQFWDFLHVQIVTFLTTLGH